jgi:hypothetical protein
LGLESVQVPLRQPEAAPAEPGQTPEQQVDTGDAAPEPENAAQGQDESGTEQAENKAE